MEFRYSMSMDGNDYGSKLTDIARAVQKRQQELEERQAGTYKPKPLPLWSDMVEKYHAPRRPNIKTGYDLDCCRRCACRCCPQRRSCPDWCRGLFWGKRSRPIIHTNQNGEKELFDPWGDEVDNDEEILAILDENAALNPDNCFNDKERAHLLRVLYTTPTTPQQQKQQELLQLYMLHMTLSNTVKPYWDGPREAPVLKFQPESAEELAMVNFSKMCGFTKLPEKEQNEKSEYERSVGANTFIAIQHYDPITLKPAGDPEQRTFVFLAVFGFTSARARVTVIYQDLSTGKILVMIKGQDTTVLPIISLENSVIQEETLLSTLKECCDNGLRTLVTGHAEREYSWWEPWGKAYNELKNQPLDEKTRAKKEHELYESIEKDAKIEFLGCIGLEDQLQPLVPETIQACLRAGIKVFMITGDKLETARNIGLACNLIDSDMQPQIKAGDTVQEAMTAVEESRLIEITGEWNRLFQNTSELQTLFDIIDYDHDGYISIAEMVVLMQTLNASVDESQVYDNVINMIFDNINQHGSSSTASDKVEQFHVVDLETNTVIQLEPDTKSISNPFSTPMAQTEGTPLAMQKSTISSRTALLQRNPNSIAVDKATFVLIVRNFEKSPYEAILNDVEQGLDRYHAIGDHYTYPVSVLLSREAFLVMFPEQGAVHDKRWPMATQMELEYLRGQFFELVSVSKSLIFARAQPSMKKKMVTEIMARVPSAITLAIGDGANDTDMITAAHIGVGIAGVEGTAATNSADYAIGTFRMLHTLLFVHGFWTYQRIANLVNFIFYKAVLLGFTQFIYVWHTFSGAQLFNDSLLQTYNVLFTALPIIGVAIFDKQLPRQTAENNVVLYKEQQHQSFNFFVFGLWILRAILHSLLMFYIPMVCFLSDNAFPSYTHANPSIENSGVVSRGTVDQLFFSTTVFYCTALLPTLNIFYINKSISLINIIFCLISLFLIMFVPWFLSLSAFFSYNPSLYGVVSLMYSSPTWWLVIIITLFVPMLAELSWQVFVVQYFPSLTQILQEQLYVVRREEKRLNKQGIAAYTQRQRIDNVAGKGDKHALRNVEIIKADGSVVQGDETGLSRQNYGTTGSLEQDELENAVIQLQRPVLRPEDEHVWLEVKTDNVFVQGEKTIQRQKNTARLIDGILQRHRFGGDNKKANVVDSATNAEAMRSGFVRALLRFRSQTGSSFDSAAQSKYHHTQQAIAPETLQKVNATTSHDAPKAADINRLKAQQSQMSGGNKYTAPAEGNLFSPIPIADDNSYQQPRAYNNVPLPQTHQFDKSPSNIELADPYRD